ncbi:YktB family protein [Pseudalkalibacillus caeni]|uniref:UPF0637 protein FCL54_07625 n=1 Tax=Exobacillus caeni TaxID=2574798 RepID=A0A5R9F5S6_9BACL|nr:DUF1054 domain-containing protein [Pseudalkalibacillus caeni]TLS37686.1 DUF1054 domain-containing protein [Pseudalkalibacillus caeni]
MTFKGFTDADFNTFRIEGLDERMDVLKTTVRPKLEALGEHFAPTLSSLVGDEMFYHVAKHARRTKNPPNDTWVAFANSKRGYKKLPHFQIGLWESHVFVWFAVIYESPIKASYAALLDSHVENIRKQIPAHYVWSIDHTRPEATPFKEITFNEFDNMTDRLANVKKAELLCGIHLPRDNKRVSDGNLFIETVSETFETLMPLYRLAQQASS